LTKYNWDKLNHIQLGRYGEYLVKMEFALNGFDIYSPEIDDKGIDFIIRRDIGDYIEAQVKSVRGYNYIFFLKSKFMLNERLIAVITIFKENKQPDIYVIPSMEWTNPNALLVSRDYIGKKSKPEWGINLSKRNESLLEPYSFSKMIKKLYL